MQRLWSRSVYACFPCHSRVITADVLSRYAFSSSTLTNQQLLPPLLRLNNVQIPSSLLSVAQDKGLSWTIRDDGSSECWAIIGPASEEGGAVRRHLVDLLVGKTRPLSANQSSAIQMHQAAHPFLTPSPSSLGPQKRHSEAIKHVSFATKMGGSSSSGDFTNYSARYGAIRDEDRVTLYERLMELLDCSVGLVAQQNLVPDPLAPPRHDEDVGRFKYRTDAERQDALQKAQAADAVIKQMAPLLLIDDALLHRPVIALSNGQTRRARILSSLITGAELVVLEEPFSGIDASTRIKLYSLFEQLHAQKKPRLVLVLREQDIVPSFVTHTLCINENGQITQLGPRSPEMMKEAHTKSEHSTSVRRTEVADAPSSGGYESILANAQSGIGCGDSTLPALVALNQVSIIYGRKTVLDRVDLAIHPGDRWVLAGDNGSGKTTLLALLLGDHPKSFSFDAKSLSLFGHARDHKSNARTWINRRVGHLSPELYNAFPRKSAHLGGLTLGEVVASGFENVFARRQYTEAQKERVYDLLALFADLIKTPQGRAIHDIHFVGDERPSTIQWRKDDLKQLSSRGFTELSHGSQAVVLFLRAMVGHPKLVILDEPFQGMDRKQVERTRAFLDHPTMCLVGTTEQQRAEDAKARRNMAVVVVSHYESEWPATFGKLLRLRDGVVVERIP